MSEKSALQTKKSTPKPTVSRSQLGILQRTCDCGGVSGLTGKCEACSSKRLSGQRRTTNLPTDGQINPLSKSGQLPGHSFGQIAVQAKLAIGQPNDKYEQEADRVADQVMRMPEPSVQRQMELEVEYDKRGLSPMIASPRITQLQQHQPVIAREEKQNSPSKEEIEKSKKQRDAIALFWNDLHTYFPGEGRKLAGSGYDDTVDYLTTSFQEGETMAGGVKTSRSAPIIYVGRKYLSEPDIDKRKAAIRAELDKIDVFRFDNARIDNDDLNNTAIASKLGKLNIFGKQDYLKRLEAQKFNKNDKVQEYIRRSMPSTPLGAGAVATTEGGFELQFENIKIVVKPDVFNSAAVATNEAHTEIKRTDSETYKTKPGFNWGKDQKVNSMTFTPSVPQLIYKVETHYGPQSNPSYTSGYGVGTRPEDKAGNTSLRFHEGMHGTVFIQFIRENISKHSFPVFDGKLGDNKDAFGKKVEAYERKVLAFNRMLKDAMNASEQQVDCVGKTIEQYHTEKGTTSTVKCHKP